jgi:transcriptional regulator with XRE-family HTH domain
MAASPEKKERKRPSPKADKIRRLLKKGGLTTGEIAKKMGCASSTVSEIKRRMGQTPEPKIKSKAERIDPKAIARIIGNRKSKGELDLEELLAIDESKLDEAGRAELLKKLRAIDEQKLREETEKLQLVSGYIDTHQIEYFRPYWYQKKVTDAFRAGKNIVIQPLSNKVGKTRIGSALVHSWGMGYEAWNPVPDTFRGAVRVGDKFFMPSSLGILPPVEIRITGEDWEEHVGNTLMKELKAFALPGLYETSKNNVGVEAHWINKKNGSVFSLMTYKQDPALFESFVGHGWWPDEPPPESIWGPMSRALFTTGGKVFMSMTPIKEPWIYDNLMRSGRPDVEVVQNVSLWDAPHLYDADLNTLMKCGFTQEEARKWLGAEMEEARKTKYLPESEAHLREKLRNRTVKFITEFGQELELDAFAYAAQNLKIYRFIKDLKDETERLPRVFGIPKHLMGLVWKNFNPDVHKVAPFKIPIDWPVEFQIDFHPNEKHAIIFHTIDPWGRHFFLEEVFDHLTNDQIVDEIARRKQKHQWRMRRGEIDALAKGDSSYVRNRFGQTEDSFYVIERGLKKHGINLGVGSKSEQNYIAAVDEWMTHVPPLFYIFDNCVEAISQIERWTRDDNGKPSDKGHFPECIGRASQTGLKYTDPQQWSRPLNLAQCPV